MIIDRIDPIALRLPKSTGPADALYLVLCKVTVRSGLVGYGECLCLRPAMQQSLLAAIRDAIAPLFLGKSVEQTRAPEPRSPAAPGLVRPRRDQSQCPGRRRHGAVGYRRQGSGSFALRPAGRGATSPRAGDGQPRSLQRRGQGHGAYRAGVGRQGRRGQGSRVRPRCHRSGAQGRRPADALRRRLQQCPHPGGRSGQPGALAGARSPVAGRSGVAARSLARSAEAFPGRGRPGRRSRLRRAARGLCQGAFRRRPAARHLHDRRGIGDQARDGVARARSAFRSRRIRRSSARPRSRPCTSWPR